MLPRTEQQEIIRRIRQEDFKAKAQEHKSLHKSKTSVEKHKTNIAVLFHNQVETNAATGYSPPQTYAQLKRLKSEVSSQYKRNYISSGTSQSSVLLKPPQIASYKTTLHPSEVKRLARSVLKGEYNLEEEEDRLNTLLLS